MMTTEMMTETRRELPRGWRWVRIGDVCVSRTGVRDPGSTPDEFFSYVDIGSVDNKTKRIIEAKRLLGNEAPSRARQVIRTSDVIVATTRPNLNAVALVPPELDNEICSTGFCVLRSQDKLEPQFLFAYVQSEEFVNALSDLVKGALYPAVTDSQVRDQLIPLPPLAEQQRIAALLNDQMAAVERARAAAEARLEAARALPAAYLREVFESDEARGWKVIPLGNVLLDIQAGKSLTCEERPAHNDEYGVLKVSAISWGAFRQSENKVPPKDYVPPITHEVKNNDLLISRANTTELVGAVVLVNDTRPGLFLSDKTLRIIPNEGVVSKSYLEIALRHSRARKFIEENATGTSSSMKNISQEIIRKIPIPIPDLVEQQRIAKLLEERRRTAERLVASITAQLHTLQAIPAALLREAFRGAL